LAEGSFLHPRDVVREGQSVQVRVIDIDPNQQRLRLSLRLNATANGAPPKNRAGNRISGVSSSNMPPPPPPDPGYWESLVESGM
jgi:ribosomal protein S1